MIAYWGQDITFQDSQICLGEYMPQKDCFSLAFWIKTDGVAQAAIFSNANWQDDTSTGFNVLVRSYGILFEYGTAQAKEIKIFAYPRDFRDGWMHVVLVVDRYAKEVRLSYDFNDFVTEKLKEELTSEIWKEPKKVCRHRKRIGHVYFDG